MWHNARDHTVELEDCCDFYEQRWKVGSGGAFAWTSADARDLDLVGPAYEECRFVLPVECALEQISARAICWAVDEGDAGLRVGIVDLHALYDRRSERHCYAYRAIASNG